MGVERRKHARLRAELSLRVTQGKRVLEGTTVDVAIGGFSAIIDSLVPMRQLLKFDFELPGDPVPLRAMGMAVRVSPEPGGRAPRTRVGVQLFGMDRLVAERWARFVFQLKSRPTPAPEGATANNEPRPELRIRPRNQAELESTVGTLSSGLLRIRTGSLLDPGTPVRIVIVHPDEPRELSLDARVTPSTSGAQDPALTFKIMDLEAMNARLPDFLHQEGSISLDISWDSLSLDAPGGEEGHDAEYMAEAEVEAALGALEAPRPTGLPRAVNR